MRRFTAEDNIQIVDIPQEGEEWLEWRRQGVGSSDVALLMSPKPLFDRTVGTIWKQKVGYERQPELDNEHIQRGKYLEPFIRDKVNELLGSNFEPTCVSRLDAPYLRASLDGIDYDLDAILEIKAPSPKVFSKYLETWEIPENYYLQIQYQMLCSNVEYAYFAFAQEVLLNVTTEGYSGYKTKQGEPAYIEVYIIMVRNDHELQLDIERRCALFWKGVETKTPVGWKEETLSLYHSNPTMLIVLCDYKQFSKLLTVPCVLRKETQEIARHKDSFVYLCPEIHKIPRIKEANPHHKVKMVCLIDTPFGKKVRGAYTEKGLERMIRDLI